MPRRLLGLVASAVLAATAACGSSSPNRSSSTSTTSSSQNGSFSQQVQQQLQQVVSTAQQQYHLPGMVVTVNVAGQGSWAQAVGVADTSTGQPANVNDKFKIGSITKTFTATVILQLVQQGKLSLSAPISQWVPNVQNANAITVQMLLDMTSGIADEGGPGSIEQKQVAANPSQVFTPQQVVADAVAQGPAGPPGQFEYSDTNYQILAIIAQAVTGQPLQNLIASQILQPLGLGNTSYPSTAAVPAPATTGYTVVGTQVAPASQPDPSALGGAGAMISTAGDLQVWAQAVATGKLLSPATQQQRLQLVPTGITFSPVPGTGQAGLPLQYGLGIVNAGGYLGHNGITNGYNAEMWYLPSQRATIVVLANGDSATAFGGAETATDAVFVSIAGIITPTGVTTAPTTSAPASSPATRER